MFDCNGFLFFKLIYFYEDLCNIYVYVGLFKKLGILLIYEYDDDFDFKVILLW